MLKYLLLGRIGSGREHFQKMLEEKGFKIAKSYTDRKKRDENDASHYFNADYIPDEDRLFETNHNGNVYFYTAEEIENAEIIPIDPENVKNICKFYPEYAFRFICIMASNEDRIKHAVSDADDKLIAEEEFISMCEEENDAFCEFEDLMIKETVDIDNMFIGHAINNDFTEKSDMLNDHWDKKLRGAFTLHANISSILSVLAEHDIISYNKDTDTFNLVLIDKRTDEEIRDTTPRSHMIEQTILDSQGMYHIMSAWLSLNEVKI